MASKPIDFPTDPRPPDSPAGIDRAALMDAVRMNEQAVDAIYLNAMSISRLIGLGPSDIPRLCVMAACRMTERMIESYKEHRADLSEADRDRKQTEIGAAFDSLIGTLTDGLKTAQTIQASLAVKGSVQ